MKKMYVFDLDETLTPSKSPLPEETRELLKQLLEKAYVGIISGGDWSQYIKQVTDFLPVAARLDKLFMAPTNGSKLYAYKNGQWEKIYSFDLAEDVKNKIISEVNRAVDALGLRPEQPYGELIEDRETQITYSGLGQQAPRELKVAWDTDKKKRHAILDMILPNLPELGIGVNGSSSIDFTQPGVDKAYGLNKLCELTGVTIAESAFVGDALFEGGNDFTVVKTGVETITTTGPEQTVEIIKQILIS